MSAVTDVIDAASLEIAATGKVSHLFTTCTPSGEVNVVPDFQGVTCTACEINRLARIHRQAQRAVRRLS